MCTKLVVPYFRIGQNFKWNYNWNIYSTVEGEKGIVHKICLFKIPDNCNKKHAKTAPHLLVVTAKRPGRTNNWFFLSRHLLDFLSEIAVRFVLATFYLTQGISILHDFAQYSSSSCLHIPLPLKFVKLTYHIFIIFFSLFNLLAVHPLYPWIFS